jgi:hypothetical protein
MARTLTTAASASLEIILAVSACAALGFLLVLL